MKLNTNRWNRLRYTLWAPAYDGVGRRFAPYREHSLQLLAARPGDRVLIVGAGTGADLPYLSPRCSVLATDITLAMLRRARPHLRSGSRLAVMDGQELGLATASFDRIVLHLIVAVIPDPERCLREAARVLRPGGRAVVFDKFVRGRAPLLLRLLNVVAGALFTDVTRDFETILARSAVPLAVVHDAPALLGGLFRYIVLERGE